MPQQHVPFDFKYTTFQDGLPKSSRDTILQTKPLKQFGIFYTLLYIYCIETSG